MVTRLPGSWMEPSTLPSIYSDSEPVTSPLITRLLPIVACSCVFRTALRLAGAGVGSAAGAGREFSMAGAALGFVWVGVAAGVLFGWFDAGGFTGFHIRVLSPSNL